MESTISYGYPYASARIQTGTNCSENKLTPIVVAKMQALADRGLRFSLDDYGTGYSSLAYLKKLPIHELKIDRSFIRDAATDTYDAALVDAIISVARNLNLTVVAEGLKTEQHVALLLERPGELMQGYHFGRPEPVEDFLKAWQAQEAVLLR